MRVFSAALRYSSARGLFCYAARKGCKVRSIDYVAAYLQGKFIEGEVIAVREALSGGAKQLGLITDRDPTKNKPGDEKKTKKPKPPRRLDGSKRGELLKWVEGMDPCKCGGKHPNRARARFP